VNPDFLIRD